MVPRRLQVPLCSSLHGLRGSMAVELWQESGASYEPWEQEGMSVPTPAEA